MIPKIKPKGYFPHSSTDEDGYLVDFKSWSEKIAIKLADDEGIKLSTEHWELIYIVKEYFLTFNHAPSMRPLVNWTKQKLGNEKGTSSHLYLLFPISPPKQLSRIAGLPKPKNCI